ncbi:MAG: MCE family protein [Lentisphaeria bacterium]|nr:MCE family protein [Lentisphaeria bacterium]
MIERATRVKLGGFVVSAVLLALVALILLAGTRWNEETFSAYTCVDESVQGLVTGGDVKLRGVPVGKVSDIRILREQNMMRIDLEIDIHKFGATSAADARRYLHDKIKEGARARLELAGITGFRYINIGFHDPASLEKTIPLPEGGEGFGIPAMPSMLREIGTDVSQAMMKLSQIDFAALANNTTELVTVLKDYLGAESTSELFDNVKVLATTLKDLSERISKELPDGEISRMLDGLNTMTAGIRALSDQAGRELDAARIPELGKQASGTLDQIGAAVQKLNKTLDQVQKDLTRMELPETTASMRQTMARTELTLRRTDGVRDDLREALEDFSRAMKSFNNVLETLDADPGALIRGKRTPVHDTVE